MDAEKLKEMGASEVVWLAIHLSGKKRRQIEEALELVPGQIDRWSSRKDHHTPSLEVLPELVEATTVGGDVSGNVLVQWLFARVRDRNLQYDPQSLSITEMERQLLHLASEFGQIATCVSRLARTIRLQGQRQCGSSRRLRTSSGAVRRS